jgi:hypothetical protein
MDERKPAIPSSEFRLRSAPARTAADIDPPPAELATSDELAAVERQRRSGQIEPRRNDFSDGPSVAVYYRNEQEASEGFLIALSAMGFAQVEQLREPAMPPVCGGKAVNTRNFPYLPLCVLLLAACGPTVSRGPPAPVIAISLLC